MIGPFAAVPREAFLAFFRVDEADPQDYQAGIPQALRLMNSGQTNATQTIADQAIKTGGGDANKALERLFLAVLSRPPTQAELTRLGDFVKKQSTPRQGYSDVVWALARDTGGNLYVGGAFEGTSSLGGPSITPNGATNAFVLSLDPHSNYFSARNSEEYNIQMSLSYEGIGASLTLTDDYVTVIDVIGRACSW